MFGYTVKYGKAWKAKQTAFEILYGGLEESYNHLGMALEAMAALNPGMYHLLEPLCLTTRIYNNETVRVFGRAFWTFGPCIREFQNCRPVMAVGGAFPSSQAADGKEVDREAAERMPSPRSGGAVMDEEEMVGVGSDALADLSGGAQSPDRSQGGRRLASPTRRKMKTLEFGMEDYFKKDFKEGNTFILQQNGDVVFKLFSSDYFGKFC
jgi:hypothetical protein